MRTLIYAVGVSADGYINGPDGSFDWAAPDDELHRFHNQQTAELGAHLLGRRMYEQMLPWELQEWTEPTAAEFAAVWRALPKVVFSTTLTAVQGTNARLATRSLEEEVAALPDTAIAVGGAGLAGALAARGLIDEFRLFLNPVVVGGGTPYWPPTRIDLELVETRRFGSQVVYLRYRRR
jgi:dihydrofolate reductase